MTTVKILILKIILQGENDKDGKWKKMENDREYFGILLSIIIIEVDILRHEIFK